MADNNRLGVRTLARANLREKTTDSFSDADLNLWFSQVYRNWSKELGWPEAKWERQSVAETQEYDLPTDIIKIFRVYLRGNRLYPTTIPMLEGDVRQVYDATWLRLASETPLDATTPLTGGLLPITAGPAPSRLFYYLRGGFVGIVPKPDGAYLLRIDGSAIVADVTSDSETLAFPHQMVDGIAWGVAKMAAFSDDRMDAGAYFENQETKEMNLAKAWRRALQGDLQPIVQTYDYRGHWGRRG